MKHAWLGFFLYVVCVLKGKSDYPTAGGRGVVVGVAPSSNTCSYSYHCGC